MCCSFSKFFGCMKFIKRLNKYKIAKTFPLARAQNEAKKFPLAAERFRWLLYIFAVSFSIRTYTIKFIIAKYGILQ